MNIEIEGIDVQLTEAIETHVRDRLAAAVGQHENYIELVQVRLKDVNGPKGGVDKECDVQVKLRPPETVIVKETDEDLYAAVSHAADRVKVAVTRKVDKVKDKRT